MNKSISFNSEFKSKLVLPLLLLLTNVNVYAQQVSLSKDNPIKILDSYIELNTNSDCTRLKELVYEVQSSIYLYNNELKTYGSSPVNLYTDINGFLQLSQTFFQKETIELITIRIDHKSQIKSALNLAPLSAFTKLKYVYILTTFPYTLEQISQVVSNSNYIVVYKSDMGS